MKNSILQLRLCREHYVGWDDPRNVLDATRYRQMAGRAGRAGIDSHGEAILIAPRKPGMAKKLAELMDVRSPPSAPCATRCVPSLGAVHP